MSSPLRRLRKGKPGSVDALNTRETYPGTNPYQIPDIEPTQLNQLPEHFHAWPNRKHAKPERHGIHCFTDDYRFEPLLRNPDRYAEALTPFVVVGPDCSVYPEYPRAVQIWQIYRARWIVAALQSRGVTCIPAVTWAGQSSFDVCFAGLSKGSTVAVSAYGATRNEIEYRCGYEAMLEVVEPTKVIVIGGKRPAWMANCIYYPSSHLEQLRGR